MTEKTAANPWRITLIIIAALVAALIIYTIIERMKMTPEELKIALNERFEAAGSCQNLDVSGLLDAENTLVLEVSTGGCVVIETYPGKAPNHVARFKELAREGFYENIVFHRVIENFMVQTGDPTGTGSGGSGQNIDAEFNDIAHEKGVVSTARSADPNSADSQFFIMLGASPHLDGQYTAWGRVVYGMENIDAIQKGEGEGGMVPEDKRDHIVRMVVASDMPVKKTD